MSERQPLPTGTVTHPEPGITETTYGADKPTLREYLRGWREKPKEQTAPGE